MTGDPLVDVLRHRRDTALDLARRLAERPARTDDAFDSAGSSLFKALYSAQMCNEYLTFVERTAGEDTTA